MCVGLPYVLNFNGELKYSEICGRVSNAPPAPTPNSRTQEPTDDKIPRPELINSYNNIPNVEKITLTYLKHCVISGLGQMGNPTFPTRNRP